MADKNTRITGAECEQKAVKFLKEKNFSIIKTNYRVGRLGEIDIIARDGEYICFIEVKARSSNIFGTPGEAVTYQKQKKIRQIASIYLSNTDQMNNSVRFDIAEIQMKNIDGRNQAYHINLIKNAF